MDAQLPQKGRVCIFGSNPYAYIPVLVRVYLYIYVYIYIYLYIYMYIYIYEQRSKLAETKICIGWTLVFRKCKKLRLAMGPFQIAIPHVELNS